MGIFSSVGGALERLLKKKLPGAGDDTGGGFAPGFTLQEPPIDPGMDPRFQAPDSARRSSANQYVDESRLQPVPQLQRYGLGRYTDARGPQTWPNRRAHYDPLPAEVHGDVMGFTAGNERGPQEVDADTSSQAARLGTVVGRDAPMTLRHMNGSRPAELVHPEHEAGLGGIGSGQDEGFYTGSSPATEPGKNMVWMPSLQRAMRARADRGELRPDLSSEPDEPGGVTMKRQDRIAPSRQRYLNAVASEPTEQEYIEGHRPHGFGQRLLSAGKFAGREFLRQGLNPGAALTGLTLGLADKDSAARANYRESVEPNAVRRQRRLLDQARGELGMSAEEQDIGIRRDQNQRAAADARYKESRRPFEEQKDQAQLENIQSETRLHTAQTDKAERDPIPKNYDPMVALVDGKPTYVDRHTGRPIPEMSGYDPYKADTEGERKDEAHNQALLQVGPLEKFVKAEMDRNRAGFDASHGVTAIAREQAKRSSSDTVNPAAENVAKVEAELRKAAIEAYNNAVELKAAEIRGKSGGGNAGGGRGATASGKRDPRIGKVFKEKGTGRKVKVIDIDRNGDPVRQYVN